NGNITAFNQTLVDILGSTKEKVANINTKKDLKNEAHISALQEALNGKMSYYEGEYVSFTGSKTSFLKTVYAPFFDKEGKVIGGISMSEDITERKQAERKIKTALKEKELLIKEVYHRAKNNLQTTISLINIQMNESKNPELISALKETQNRLFAMANVHEVLCKTESLDNILLKDYVKDLISNYSYAKISYETNVEETLALTVDQTNAVGLILNELITNSIKHNLANHILIKIDVHINDQNKIEFNYSDTGVGLPEDKSFSESALGMNLVQVLVEDQLDGELEWLREKGFHIIIKF
ncbi:MAG: histidine kinase dimerization/phosphoacceptor domain -containing protein, partial [Bacteroidia bacterium]